jgi:hypothetical protein
MVSWPLSDSFSFKGIIGIKSISSSGRRKKVSFINAFYYDKITLSSIFSGCFGG